MDHKTINCNVLHHTINAYACMSLIKRSRAESFTAAFTLTRQELRNMSLHKYFKRTLPTSQETGFGESTTKELMKECRLYWMVGRRERKSQKRCELSTAMKTERPFGSTLQRT